MRLGYALLLIAADCLCRAESTCLWLNAATAGGVLGGPVTQVLKPEVCEFARDQATLHIEVQKKPASITAKCESRGTPLKAIGNEAIACGNSISGGFTREMIFGRVRDQRFVVWIQTSDPSLKTDIKERTRKIAEQVAGSLF